MCILEYFFCYYRNVFQIWERAMIEASRIFSSTYQGVIEMKNTKVFGALHCMMGWSWSRNFQRQHISVEFRPELFSYSFECKTKQVQKSFCTTCISAPRKLLCFSFLSYPGTSRKKYEKPQSWRDLKFETHFCNNKKI